MSIDLSLEAERLVQDIAHITNESFQQVIINALKERLALLQVKEQRRNTKEKLSDILHRLDELPDLDSRTADEILGYKS